MINYADVIKDYWTNGYAVIPNFLSPEQVEIVMDETYKIIDDIDLNGPKNLYRSGKQEETNDYFFKSCTNISHFFEETAFDSDGNLVVPKRQCLHKIGFYLHAIDPIFKFVTMDGRIKTLFREAGFVEPHFVESLVNFKHARIGTTIPAHQDATFLYTEPQIKLMGFWIPLEDATLENGCLWFIPGSHNEPVRRRWIRNKEGQEPRMIFTCPEIKYDESKFVPVPVPKGSLVLIHGQVVHKSEPNRSNKSRPALTFHAYDAHQTSWSTENWIRPTKEAPFIKVY
uniref:Fe2OG dioxygenase domain-containing protein n=1 Tax=Tetranychus urticae TaxID=32264 RepID=T1KQ56_TETUR